MYTRQDIRNRAAKQFSPSPQNAQMADMALTEIYAALDRLQAIGFTYSLVPDLASNYMPAEWPKWENGQLWNSQEHLDSNAPHVLLEPFAPAEAGNINRDGKVPLHAIVLEDRDD